MNINFLFLQSYSLMISKKKPWRHCYCLFVVSNINSETTTNDMMMNGHRALEKFWYIESLLTNF